MAGSATASLSIRLTHRIRLRRVARSGGARDWNTQIPELYYYEASLWYRRRFTTAEEESGRTFVHFGAVNHSCTIYLDGDVLASHEGGYGPFAVEVTGRIGAGDIRWSCSSTASESPSGFPQCAPTGSISAASIAVSTSSGFEHVHLQRVDHYGRRRLARR